MSVIFYNKERLKKVTRWRWGETKFGEEVETVDDWQQLEASNARYVILGIPEDIGVRANYGRPGAAEAWKECLRALCNIQSNDFTNATNVVILGEVNCTSEMQDARQLTVEDPFYPTKIGSLVKAVDDKVSQIIENIVSLHKIPIVIGGGHNNSYGNLKGSSKAFAKPINCINMDAHSDFRAMEHRHSGNGFSYAMEEGFLNNYYIFGLHQNYTSRSIFEQMNERKTQIKFKTFEAISLSETADFLATLEEAKKHSAGDTFGLELDLDAIAAMGSSAISPSGFTLEEARKFIGYFSKNKHCCYVHLCEGSPTEGMFTNQVGKTLAYLISDIISS